MHVMRVVVMVWTLALLGGCTTTVEEIEIRGGYRHLVLFAFKPDTSEDTRRAIEAASAALPEAIPQIRAFEWGTDITAGERAQGYTHCMLFTFAQAEDIPLYRDHPAHQAFMKSAMPHIAQLLVIDYRATP